MQTAMLAVGAGAVATAVVASLADRRRLRRRDVEQVGFMPWPLITMISIIVALFATALGIKGG